MPKPTLIATAFAALMAIAFSANYTLQAEGRSDDAAASVEADIAPGDVLRDEQVRVIERPGEYGLGSNLEGSRYAISDGHLIRIDAESLRVQSILRSGVEPDR